MCEDNVILLILWLLEAYFRRAYGILETHNSTVFRNCSARLLSFRGTYLPAGEESLLLPADIGRYACSGTVLD